MGRASYTALTTPVRWASVYSPLRPIQYIFVSSAPKLLGIWRLRWWTDENVTTFGLYSTTPCSSRTKSNSWSAANVIEILQLYYDLFKM